MRLKTYAAISLLTALFAASGALAAEWKPIGQALGAGNERIKIDRSRLGYGGDGLVAVWSRLVLPQAVSDAEGRYNVIEALNRYSCAGNRFATLKRLYLLDEVLVRVEPVLTPKEVSIAVGSPDAAIVAEVCKASGQRPLIVDTKRPEFGSGLMYADVQKLTESESPPRYLAAADAKPSPKPAPEVAAPAPPAMLRPLISYPRIEPADIQHPTDEVKPAEPKSAEPDKTDSAAAVKREAARSGVSLDPLLKGLDRHAREIVLATSGPKRKAAATAPAQEAAAFAARQDIRWGYEGAGAPANWARLRADFGLCGNGQRQSPIDIRDGIRVDLEAVKFDYRPSLFRIVDNGQTVQVNVGVGSAIAVMGRTWRLTHLQFHRPSEELIDGRGFDMSLHLVHEDDKGRLAIVAVPIERGVEHPVIQTFWNHLPLEANMELAPADVIDPNQLLPESRSYYTYMGSLTAPPCTEGVLWMVLKQPLQLSPEQIAIFSRLYRSNARPIQPANGRLVKESR